MAVKLRPLIRLAGLIGGGSRRRRQHSIALLKSSPLFDKDWYERNYPDVGGAGIDPAWHYIEFGWREGRDPGPLFSGNDYIKSNPDVARSGANPLLHFIEFGYAEGRGTSKHRAVVLSAKSPGEPFGPAAPCYSFPLPEEAPVRWRRSARFDLAASGVHTIEGLPTGLVFDPNQRALIDVAFESLRALSGYGGALPPSVTARPSPGVATLLDCWFTNHGRLRTRWKSERPIVVRAYQHDTSCDGKLRMVAEGLSGTNVDFVDVSLCNRYFPVLFVLSEPQGTVSETQLLAFPSLCRGGIHYSELLAISGKQDAGRQALDAIGHGQALTERLLALFRGDGIALVGALSIDLAGADGSGPLFQPDFREWLARVARIGIGAPEPSQRDRGGTFLASTVELSVTGPRDPRRGILILSGEMVPTVSVLTSAVIPDGKSPIDTRLSLIVPGSEASQPATLFKHPPIDTGKLRSDSAGYPPTWPRLIHPAQDGLPDQLIPAAIRLPSRHALADAELLLRVSGMSSPGPMQTITWLIWADRWQADVLARSMEALSLQTGARRCSIAFIGETKAQVPLASQFFGERVRTYPDIESAASAIQTDFVAYVGNGVILHDERCSQLLASLMVDPTIATASCVLLRNERRGKSWSVGIAETSPSDPCSGRTIRSNDAERIWRSNYPLMNPVQHLWMTRTMFLRGWTRDGDASTEERFHVCTSLVTASHECPDANEEPAIVPPVASASNSLRLEMLFG